jgi:predicted helicase
MVRSVEEILQKEFARSLGDKGVHILDPFVGTGNFVVRIMQEIKATDLQYKYENELHCNEVMLLPYYIASMNIEHAYFDRTDEYKPFPGICLVDTFDMRAQGAFFTEANTGRIEDQQKQDIFVVTGNPPYNAWQADENDNNKNRKYESLDSRVSETYAKRSRATNKNALSDPYVKAMRWASDRIKSEGIVAFVTNSGFVDGLATDGMRAHLAAEFDEIYILDLGGNVRKNPKLSGTTHNVFGIQVGVSINLLVRRDVPKEKRICKIFYSAVEKNWTRWQKYRWLEEVGRSSGVKWTPILPSASHQWLTEGMKHEFDQFVPLSTLFEQHSRGVATSRDAWAYNFDHTSLAKNIKKTIGFYNQELARWKEREDKTIKIDNFVRNDNNEISWSRDLKQDLDRERRTEFSRSKIRRSLYRPFAEMYLFFDRILNEEVYVFPSFFPTEASQSENKAICLTGPGSEKPFLSMAADELIDLHLSGGGCSTQCFPFYTYAEDGSHRRENITDLALEQFRSYYHDTSIIKWDIFHYIYAVLHHPDYRECYAANLRRELPRIPFVGSDEAPKSENSSPAEAVENSAGYKSRAKEKKETKSTLPKAVAKEPSSQAIRATDERRYERLSDRQRERVLSQVKIMQDAGEMRPVSQSHLRAFRAFAKAGQRLVELHVHYEQQPEYKLTKIEKKGEKLDYRVTKMKLSKDKTSLIFNRFLTLSDIPKETYKYRLGNRSALEWVIDQYQVSTDKRSGIINDPNRSDDPQYILRLIGQIVTVSLETVKIVESLAAWAVP